VVVLNVILESLLKWFAPILVFTTEEIYSLASKENASIHESLFVEVPDNWKNDKLDKKWSELFKIKQEANIALEEKRASKEIGSSLEAEIKIKCKKEIYDILDNLDLAEYFITSKAEKIKSENQENIKIDVKKAVGNKCPRCWKILEKECLRCKETLSSN